MLTSKYRPPYKRYAAIGLGVGLAIFLTCLYQYGAPLGYQVIGTLLNGEEVDITDQVQVHLAYTPLYSAAMQWPNFVDVAWQYLLALTGILSPLVFWGRLLHKTYKYILKHWRSDKDNNSGPKDPAPKGPPYGPYGFGR